MNFVKTKTWLLLAAPLVLLGGIAVAGVRTGNPSLAEGTDPTAGDPSKLSAQELGTRSAQITVQMTTTEARIGALLKRAENKKDMVMVNCVTDKLVQVRGYVAVGNASAQAMVAARDDAARVHQFERQSIVYQKVLVLGTEAEGCVGEDVSYVGATRVDVEIDPNIPQEDPTIPPTPVPTPDRPPEGDCPAV